MELGDTFAASLTDMQARAEAGILCNDITNSACIPPFQSKQTLNKFCDSLLTKKNKINSLIRDLDQNYGCEKATKRLCLYICTIP